jgi:hypothetical protein
MDGGVGWGQFAALLLLTLAACNKGNESTSSASRSESETPTEFLTSYGLTDVRGMDAAGLSGGGVGACTEDGELFTGCEALIVEPSSSVASAESSARREASIAVLADKVNLPRRDDLSPSSGASADTINDTRTASASADQTGDRRGQAQAGAATSASARQNVVRTATACSCKPESCNCS